MRRGNFAILATAVAIAGCGSGGSDQSGQESAGSSGGSGGSTATAAHGPSDPAENLKVLMAESNPELEDVAIACEVTSDSIRYPFECDFTARDTKKRSSVGGTISVQGVYAPTMTYAFALQYGTQ